jgi:PTH1 family peptidyl-tRNA hydrolase
MTYDGWIVVGLGNPGPSYENTRHNVGYLVADELADRMGGTWKAHKSARALAVEGRLAGMPGVRAVLGRGRCYMNESGGPVKALLSFYKATPEQLVIVYDELDLPYGDMRVKFGGGDNGHNGLKSIRSSLGTGDWYRVRVGISRPPGRQAPADYVLKPFSPTERRELDLHVNRAADAVESLLTDGLERTQNLFNS